MSALRNNFMEGGLNITDIETKTMIFLKLNHLGQV